MLHSLLFTLIMHVICAAKDTEQIATDHRSDAGVSSSHQLPVIIERAKNPEQDFKEDDTRINATDLVFVDILLARPPKMAASRKQFQEARLSPKKPGKTAMHLGATYRVNMFRNQTAHRFRSKIETDYSETDFRKRTKRFLRKIREVSWRNYTSGLSTRTYYEIVSEFPKDFRELLSITDESERELLLAYANSSSDRAYVAECLVKYNQAKRNERKMLQTVLVRYATRADEILAGYMVLRRGVAWRHVRPRKDLKEFFNRPPVLMREYETVKRDKRHSITDRSLYGPLRYLKRRSTERRIFKRFIIVHNATIPVHHNGSSTTTGKAHDDDYHLSIFFIIRPPYIIIRTIVVVVVDILVMHFVGFGELSFSLNVQTIGVFDDRLCL